MVSRKKRVMAVGILIAVFNVLVFVLPFVQTTTFWISYIFGMVALVSIEFGWIFAWEKASTLKNKFLGIPILQLGLIYLIVQVIASLALIAASFIPWQVALIEGVVWLAINAILIMSADIGRDAIEKIDQQVSAKTSYIKSLQAEVNQMVNSAKDEELKRQLKDLADAIRYSDPISDPALGSIEDNITQLIENIKNCIGSENSSEVIDSITEARSLLNERNTKIKFIK